ncbi:hypothetical protein D1BOALGB6SA_1448 [Olavius sp. associated proteobacterium Delta 1]|nr:hypothetical protein D1BOALGB6SA_1448 [Olavius sp. associated proteobacterium Delta 1]
MTLKRNPVILMILIGFILLSGCTNNRMPNLLVAEEKMVRDCQYLDTISESSDPGKFVTNYQLVEYYDGELKVLERANNMKATHIVWMYNHPIGSSASAYRCVK